MKIFYPNPNSIEFEEQFNQLIKLTRLMVHEIGYVVPVFYRKQAQEKKLLLLMIDKLVVGFCSFNIRKKDNIGVIYEIGTHPIIRGKGGAILMIEEVLKKCLFIQLKCPVDNKSNKFYERIAIKTGVEQGKKRKLNVWQITTKTAKEKQ